MDDEIRRLERRAKECPGDVQAAVALDNAKGRAGLPTVAARLRELSLRLSIEERTHFIDGFYILGRPISNDKCAWLDGVWERMKNQKITFPPELPVGLRELRMDSKIPEKWDAL